MAQSHDFYNNGDDYYIGGRYNYNFYSSARMDSKQAKTPTQKMDDVSISKNLSNILRHTAEKLNLNLDSHGYIFVDDLLKLKRFTGVTPDDIKRIVKSNDKQRFSLITEERSNKLKIRANQGHSGKFEDLNLDLVPIEDPEKYPVVHGTYEQNWTSISKEGLKKMKRVHIHFAPGLAGDNCVISGMRATCDIYIYIDMKKALQDGLKFFMSANNVILSSGDKNGIIAPKYFSKVVHKNGNVLKDDNPKKKLPVGMVLDEKSKNEQSKKKNKGNAEKNSTDKDASNPKKKKSSEENNDKTENVKNSDKKKGKNAKKEGAAEKVATEKPNENKTETGGKKKGADKSAAVTENPGDASKKKNQDKKSSDKEASNPKKKKTPQENKSEDAKNTESKKKKSPKEAEGEKKSTAKPTGGKADAAGKKKSDAKSENSGTKATKNSADSTKKTKNEDKKSSDSSKKAGAATQKAQDKNSVVTKDTKADLPKITQPTVFIINDAKDERLNPLREQFVIGVHILQQKEKIVYVLISMPGTVFVFDPTVTKELLKEILLQKKCLKVMYDTSIIYDLYQQCGIVLFKGHLADIQIMQDYTDKNTLSNLSEIVGEVCGKIPPPANIPLFDEMSEKLQEKSKHVMKTLSCVSVLRHLFENYKLILEKSRRATFTKYNKKFDDATRDKILKSLKTEATPAAAATVKKPASQPSSNVAPQQKSKKAKK